MTVSKALTLLGLDDRPCDRTVTRKYRQCAVILHPDRHKNSATATELLRRYTEAKNVLLATPQPRRVHTVNRGSATNRGSKSSPDFEGGREFVASVEEMLNSVRALAGSGDAAARLLLAGLTGFATYKLLDRFIDR